MSRESRQGTTQEIQRGAHLEHDLLQSEKAGQEQMTTLTHKGYG
jgi:hypothetical protein